MGNQNFSAAVAVEEDQGISWLGGSSQPKSTKQLPRSDPRLDFAKIERPQGNR